MQLSTPFQLYCASVMLQSLMFLYAVAKNKTYQFHVLHFCYPQVSGVEK